MKARTCGLNAMPGGHRRLSHVSFATFAALGIVGLQACVPANAGYEDVRQLTAARIHHDVRWYEHDSASNVDKDTKALMLHPLNADGAVQIALLNNQGLQAAFEELGIARAGLVHALRLPNPTVDAALRFKGSSKPNIDVNALEDLSELLYLPLRNGVAGAQLEVAKASVVGRVLDHAFAVRSAFYGYQASTQIFELARSSLGAARASFIASQQLHEAGNVTDLALASEHALYEESRLSYIRAEASLHAQRDELNALMGLWGKNAGWTAEARLPEAGSIVNLLDKLEQRALANSLDLQILRHRGDAAAKRAHLATLQGWLPELKAGASAERDERGAWGVGPAAVIAVPLFYQGQGESGAALAEARQQQKLFADTAVQIRAAARAVATELAAVAKSVRYVKSTLLPLRAEIVDGTQLQYNAMGVGVSQLIQAKRDQITAVQTYIALLRDYWILRAEAEALVAGRLPKRGLTSEEATRDAASFEQGRTGGLRQH